MSGLAGLCTLFVLAAAAPNDTPRFLEGLRPERVARIVTVAPSVTETLLALGVFDRVVCTSNFDDFPPAAKSLPHVGGFLDPNLEAIVACRPDLVIAVPSAGNRDVLQRLPSLGVPVAVVPGTTLAHFDATLAFLGPMFGGAAQDRAQLFRAELDWSLNHSPHAARAARVLLVYNWNPLIVGGRTSFLGELLTAVGAENIVTTPQPYPQLSPEMLMVRGPDVIINLTGTAPSAEIHQRFAAVPAFVERRIFTPTSSAWVRPGPRLLAIVDELREMVSLR